MKSFFFPIVLVAFSCAAWGDPAPPQPALPDRGFPASRYQALWAQSPFRVETSVAAEASSDYTLVGLAQVDGVNYASVMENGTDRHFIVTQMPGASQAGQDIALLSVNLGSAEVPASVVIEKNGQRAELRLAAGAPLAPPVVPAPVVTLQIPPGGAGDMVIEEISRRAALARAQAAHAVR